MPQMVPVIVERDFFFFFFSAGDSKVSLSSRWGDDVSFGVQETIWFMSPQFCGAALKIIQRRRPAGNICAVLAV